jgi:hypothetical protein
VRLCAPAPAIQPAAAAATIAPHNILRPAFATFIMRLLRLFSAMDLRLLGYGR